MIRFLILPFLILFLGACTKEGFDSAKVITSVVDAAKHVPDNAIETIMMSNSPPKNYSHNKTRFKKEIEYALEQSQKLLGNRKIKDEDLTEDEMVATMVIEFHNLAIKAFDSDPLIAPTNFSTARTYYQIFMAAVEAKDIAGFLGKRLKIMKDFTGDCEHEISVLGRQWDWIFTYENGGQVNCHDSKAKFEDGRPKWSMDEFDETLKGEERKKELARFATVPINKVVKLNLRSEKVLHSFAVPAFRVKKDCPIGRKAGIWFKAVKKGTYIYTCNEMCGEGHGSMIGYLRVVDEAEYKEFLEAIKP